jgi:Arc/MetJ family transcription regulator
MRMSGIKTKKELVNTALRYYRDRLLRERAEEGKTKHSSDENEH